MRTIPEEPRLGENVIRNQDASGGLNERLSGRLLAENEFVALRNVDISVPGNRRKRLGPKLLFTIDAIFYLASPSYTWLWTVDDTGELGATEITGELSTTVIMASPNGQLWKVIIDDDGELGGQEVYSGVAIVPILTAPGGRNYLVTIDNTGELATVAQ